MTIVHNKTKLWNLNYFLLWQGQLVSGVGDFLFQIALGFWVLAITGSTGLMATVMASSLIPQIIISPFAGVLVDRINRKWVIVLMDVIRGVSVLFVSIAGFTGILKIWMVLVVSLILGCCLSFFNPSVQSSIPDIVEKSQIVKANAAFSMIGAFSKIVGDMAGGFLFQIFGVSVLFLVNGLSYLFSAVSELFVKIPNIHHDREIKPFFEEMKMGFSIVWHIKGLRFIFVNALITNFFRMLSVVIILPLFQQSQHLGPAEFGLVVGTAAAGAFVGFLILSIFQIEPSYRFIIMCMSGCIYSMCRIIFPFYLQMPVMLPLMFFSGIGISISIILVESSIPLAVPAGKRGRVFSLLNIATAGVWPFGMITGGILAEFIPIPTIISLANLISFTSFFLLSFVTPSRQLVNLKVADE